VRKHISFAVRLEHGAEAFEKRGRVVDSLAGRTILLVEKPPR
jgi:hypothetical protein